MVRPPPDPVLDNSSPYYVHPGDGPTSVVVTPLLTSSNYHSWSRSMKRALGAKMKFDFVTGAIVMPNDDFDPAYRAWHRCNQLISSWILNSVSPSIAQSVVFMENASDIWNDLRERFSQGDLVRISELRQEICALRQETRSVTDFYSDLKTLWEELELYFPIPACTCHHRCSCEAMRSARRNHSLLQTIRFILKSSSAHSAAIEGGSHDSNAVTPPSISQEQYDKLMSLLQHSNLAPNSVSTSSNQVGSSMSTDHKSVIHKVPKIT
ncbi:unnamed protein product [Trifolium pratense]|uniref:Uncharacterized protein n=1 Tax=Trifolium pratense TaxID=57577 RepID=A0ACB0KSW3_TRIPR|nr:unnamed protein product [Trifolium pratense]